MAVTGEKMNTTLVSVCIPVFNTVKYVRQTIESVISQQYPNIEILVQDNASTDGTWELLELLARDHPQIKIKRNQQNIGMSENWNTVIKRAQGDYVMLLSADDLLEPQFLTSCMCAFATNELDIVTTHFWYIYSDDSTSRRIEIISNVDAIYQNFAFEVLRLNPFQINFTLFKKHLIDKMMNNRDLFSKHLSCDYDLFLRLGVSGVRMKYLSKPYGYYRIHESNTSNNQKRLQWHTTLTLVDSFFPLFIRYPKQYTLTFFRIQKRLMIEIIKFFIIK